MFFVWDDDDYLFVINDWTDRLRLFLIDVDDDRTTDEDGRFRILGT